MVGEMSRRFFTNENTLTVGCSCFVDSQTVMKAKLNNHGNLGALLQHELKPKSFLTISGAFDLKPCSRLPSLGWHYLLSLDRTFLICCRNDAINFFCITLIFLW